jgi:benzaldehyde dehydrogenase (NAD)
MKITTDTLLTPTKVWSAKIYSNAWKKPGLGTAEVTEKATGAKLGEIGIASTEDVSAAAAAACQAQEDWAKVPGSKRGDVLREFSRQITVCQTIRTVLGKIVSVFATVPILS